MSSPKSIATALAAAGLVSVIGFAYAQSGDERERANDAVSTVEPLQKEQAPVNAPMQEQAVAAADIAQPKDTAATPTPQDQQPQQGKPQGTPYTNMPSPADSSNTTPSQYGSSPSTSSPAVNAASTDTMPPTTSPMDERAPRADRN